MNESLTNKGADRQRQRPDVRNMTATGEPAHFMIPKTNKSSLYIRISNLRVFASAAQLVVSNPTYIQKGLDLKLEQIVIFLI